MSPEKTRGSGSSAGAGTRGGSRGGAGGSVAGPERSGGRLPWRAALLIGVLGGVALTVVWGIRLYSMASGGVLFRLLLANGGVGTGAALLGVLIAGRMRLRALRLLLPAALAGAGLFLWHRWDLREDINVLLVVVDATRAGHLGCYGYSRDTSPHIDALARESVLFREGIAEGAATIVSTPSLLTSTYPSQHGLTSYADALADTLQTAAELFRGAGWRTLGVVANPHLTPRNGFAQGFEEYSADEAWGQGDARSVTDRFLGWLDRRPQGRFFGFLFYIDPHNPYMPPAPYDTYFYPEYRGPRADGNVQEMLAVTDEATRRDVIARYDGEIRYFDEQLGRLLGRLREAGLWDRTALILTSDHGEAFWEHGTFGHGDALYEETIRVPLLMRLPSPLRWPQIAPRVREVPLQASHLEILPTLLDYCGIPRPRQVRGTSLLPYLYKGDDSLTPFRALFLEERLTQYGPYNLKALRTPDWKLIISQVTTPAGPSWRRELYRLQDDPGELRNLAGRAGVTGTVLEGQLAGFARDMAPFAQRRPPQVTPDARTLERLKALGYVR